MRMKGALLFAITTSFHINRVTSSLLAWPQTGQQVLKKQNHGDQLVASARHERGSHASIHSHANHSHLLEALSDMQEDHFQIWIGTWPTAIDWTAAVLNNQIASTLRVLTGYIGASATNEASPTTSDEPQHGSSSSPDTIDYDNVINRYSMHSAAFYHSENAFVIRNEAFDDMLWVVLDWLEHIRFINERNDLHSNHTSSSRAQWHGADYIPAFAHRSRVFYDLASHGWDETLCDGGMVWNSKLVPYKNAITNQLFISSSINMYLHFPGDWNRSPFLVRQDNNHATAIAYSPMHGWSAGRPADRHYLYNAVRAYDWLKGSNMQDHQGLYVDGFHITGWRSRRSNGTGKCDDRNEMVYTYNQGVILSGLRGLWEATGSNYFLEDGYALLRSVMDATGYSCDGNHNYLWSGLGRGGVIEDYCDHTGHCNQDGQSFKGIFFAHAAAFCEALRFNSRHADPPPPLRDGRVDPELSRKHNETCAGVAGWVRWNADAALRNRDARGRFGGWWNAHLVAEGHAGATGTPLLPAGAVDYRNGQYRNSASELTGDAGGPLKRQARDGSERYRGTETHPGVGTLPETHDEERLDKMDPNERGRGRTVETQGAGLAVLRAAFQLSRIYSRDEDTI